MHFKTAVNALSLTKTHSHHNSEEPHVPKPVEPYRIATVSTEEEFDQLLDDHHHRRVIVFVFTASTPNNEPDEVIEEWCHHYERLNDVRFVRVDLDSVPPLEERLQPKVKPCWFTFHKGAPTGWSSGGLKRFVTMHTERKGSTSSG
jgi:hypothetical protein